MKKIMKHSMLLMVSLAVGFSSFAQNAAPIKDVDKLKEQDKVLIESYPNVFKGATIQSVEPLNDKHTKVSYTMDGVAYESVVNADRADLLLVATCQAIKNDDLPKLVKDVFIKEVKGKIEQAYLVTTPYSSELYRIDYYTKSKSTTSIFIDKLGVEQKAPY